MAVKTKPLGPRTTIGLPRKLIDPLRDPLHQRIPHQSQSLSSREANEPLRPRRPRLPEKAGRTLPHRPNTRANRRQNQSQRQSQRRSVRKRLRLASQCQNMRHPRTQTAPLQLRRAQPRMRKGRHPNATLLRWKSRQLTSRPQKRNRMNPFPNPSLSPPSIRKAAASRNNTNSQRV